MSISPIIAPPMPRGRGWDFATHKRYSYLGGDDFEVPTGTVVTSISAGSVVPDGTTVTVFRPDGTSVTLRHVHPLVHGGVVEIGQPIATSGADGGRWPHWEAFNGVRVSVYTLVTAYNAAVAAASAASSADSGRAYVRRIAGYLNGRRLGYTTAAARNGIRGPIYWRLIQLAGRQDGLYGRGYIVNGIPGPRTRVLERHYATLAK